MLTSLSIQNFKGWKDTGTIGLAPLTLLFGTNSSGKSSLHQFLLMLRQTVESPDRRRVLHAGDESTPVDLGSYSDLIHDRNTDLPLSFELGWLRSRRLDVADVRSDARISGTRMTFNAEIRATDSSPPRVYVENYGYRLIGKDSELHLGSRRESAGKYRVTSAGIAPVMTLGRKWPISSPSHFHAFPDDLPTRFQNLEFAADLTLALEEQLSSLAYLGPLREKPGRLYRWSGEEPSHVGWRGERTVEALLAGRDRSFNLRPKTRLKPLQVIVAEWLQRLGIIESFSVRSIGEGRDEYEVRVIAPGRRQEVLLTDVGFGVSQVLPVVVECFYAPSDSTLILEQPEIHLHPAVQSELADLFVEAVKMRESGVERRTQLIVESHSEHLLRRVLRRISEGSIARTDVAMYFVDSADGRSVIRPLDVDDEGNVHNWPEDFFGDQVTDMVEQSRNSRLRRQGLLNV